MKLWNTWIALFGFLLLGLGLSGPAAAQNDNTDDGQYLILQARYGTATHNVDVTPRLRELARQDRNFRLGNDSFGVDPHPGQVKTLRIYTRTPTGRNRTFEYTEGSMINGNAFTGWAGGNWSQGSWNGGWGNTADDGEYLILHARYGTASHNVDVTARVRELARADRSFRMGNTSFGVDPQPGQVKTLRIYTRGRDGRNRTFEYVEGGIVDGNLFSGWTAGNWGQTPWNGGWAGTDANDDGAWQVLQARYGTASHNVDVTQRLRDLARKDVTFRMGNDIFGVDPHPGQVKTLRIYARSRNGQNRTFEYTEGSMVDGNQFTSWTTGQFGQGRPAGGWGGPGSVVGSYSATSGLYIVSATYGAGDRQVDITERLRSQVQSDRLDVRVDNDLAGTDPAPRTPKMAWVSFRIDGGREQHLRVDERQRLTLP